MSKEEKMTILEEREKELVEGIKLFDGVKMRRMSKEDLEDLKSSIFLLPPDTLFTPNLFVLEKFIIEDDHKFQLNQTMRNIVLALRLLKKGYVSGNAIFYILVSEKKPQFVSVDWSWEEGRRLKLGRFKYVLGFDEISSLKTMIEKIQGVDFGSRKTLHLACKRFQRAYEEVDTEDQLIDLMIAFEALFVRREIAGSSKKEKIVNGCSDLLGTNDEEKEEIRSFLTKAYLIRNLIVHGAEYKINEDYELFEVISETEDYLRASINKLLD